jgi:hypothetical protein
VLDPHADAERWGGKASHIPRGVHIGVRRSKMVVHYDAVLDLEPRGFGQVEIGRNADSRHDGVHRQAGPALRLDDDLRSVPADVGHLLAWPDVHALLPVVLHEEPREVRREQPSPDSVLREQHRDLAALHGERGRDFGSDEAAPDHDECPARFGHCVEAAVILERAEVDHGVATEW